MTTRIQNLTPPSFIGIGKALSDYFLQVPQFQRSYAWDEENVKELYEDIAAAINDSDPEYFLGSIVTIQTEGKRLEVVDGQQRLATVTILLAAIRDYFHEKLDSERKEWIKSEFLLKRSLETLEEEQRLHLNAADNDFFFQRVLSSPDSAARSVIPSRPSHKKIEMAVQIAKERVAKIISETNDPTTQLNRWVLFITNKARVIWFTVSNEANAFMIFETLNDRGLALTISDLLKNYLFSRAGNRMREAEAHWMVVVQTFEAIDNQDLIVRYIHNYWSSRFGLTRERELFDKIKKRFTSANEIVEFTTDLATSSRLYAALLNPEHEYWEPFGDKLGKYRVKDCIRTLLTLRLEQYRTLLLAVLRRFSDEEIARSISMLVSWTVRFVIDGAGGGTLEKRYPEVAAKISEGKLTSADELYTEMQSVVPNDKQFHAAFATVSISRQYVARYLLTGLEMYKRGKHDPELVPNDDTLIVNLEHILPDTYSDNWRHFTQEEHKVYRNRIGNLTLLGSKKNSTHKDATFADKQRVFEASDFVLTKDIAITQSWTREAIETRQRTLADLAVKVWPAKPIRK